MDTRPSFQHAHTSHLRMDMCEQDSPIFRAALQRASDELDDLFASLEAVAKGTRGILENAMKGQETLARSLVYVRRICSLQILKVSPQALCVLLSLAELTVLLHERVVSHTAFRAFSESYAKISDAILKMRIARKISEKSRDKFESFLARFSALPRLREQPLVREDAHYLLECRKQHVQHLVSYVHAVQLAQAVVEASLCQAAIATVSEAENAGRLLWDATQALQAPADEFRQLARVQLDKTLQEWIASEEKLGEQLLANIRVRTVLDSSSGVKKANLSLPNPQLGLQPYREGYVNVRRQKGLGAIWRRVYLVLQPSCSVAPHDSELLSPESCVLLQQSVASRSSGVVETAFAINVLLIEARAHTSGDNDRRFCFEIATARKSLMYQGESDDDVREWLSAITRAKSEVMMVQSDMKVAESECRSDIEHASPTSPADSNAFANTKSLPEGQVAVPATLIEEAPGTLARASDVFREFTIGTSLGPTETIVLSTPVLLWSLKETELQNAPVLGRIIASNERLYAVSANFGCRAEQAFQWKSVADIKTTLDDFVHAILLDKSLALRFKIISANSPNVRESMLLLARNARLSKPRMGSQLVAMLQPGAEEDPLLSMSQLHDSPASCADPEADTSQICETGCGCKGHLEQTELNIIIPLSVDDLYDLILGDNSPVFNEMNVRRGHREVSAGSWNYFDGKSSEQQEFTDSASPGILSHSDAESAPSISGSSSSSESDKSKRTAIGSSPNHSHLVDLDVLPSNNLGLVENTKERSTSDTKQPFAMARNEHHETRSISPSTNGSKTNEMNGRQASPLERPAGAIAERHVRFLVPVSNPLVKARETLCHATHWIVRQERGTAYIVRQEAQTPDITYGDSFLIVTQFCLTAAGSRRCRLRVCTGITWIRSPLVKGIIRSGIMRSQAEYFRIYTTVLWPAVRSKLEALGASVSEMEKVDEAQVVQATDDQQVPGNEPVKSWVYTKSLNTINSAANTLLRIKALLRGDVGTEASVLGVIALVLGILLGLLCPGTRSHNTLSKSTESPIPDISDFDHWLANNDAAHFIPASSNALHRISRLESEYLRVRSEMEALETGLRRAECRVAQAKYATWLASQLSTCYSDMSRHTSKCDNLTVSFEKVSNPRLCMSAT